MQRRYLDWIGIFNEAGRAALYTDEFLARLTDVDPAEFLARAWRRAARRDPVTAASLADLTTYLPCDLLVKVDIASMAHGLECRQPFLDHRLVEWAAALPVRYKQRFGRGKRISARGVSRSVAGRNSAAAENGIRRADGLMAPRRTARFGATSAARSAWRYGRGYFRPEAIGRLLDEHQSGRTSHGHRIWALLVLELWHRQWVDGSASGPL